MRQTDMPKARRSRGKLGAVLLAATLVATSCGSDDDEGSATPTDGGGTIAPADTAAAPADTEAAPADTEASPADTEATPADTTAPTGSGERVTDFAGTSAGRAQPMRACHRSRSDTSTSRAALSSSATRTSTASTLPSSSSTRRPAASAATRSKCRGVAARELRVADPRRAVRRAGTVPWSSSSASPSTPEPRGAAARPLRGRRDAGRPQRTNIAQRYRALVVTPDPPPPPRHRRGGRAAGGDHRRRRPRPAAPRRSCPATGRGATAAGVVDRRAVPERAVSAAWPCSGPR